MSKAAELAALIGSQTALSNRNLIINGAMQVAQRGTSFSYAHDGTAASYNLDRFNFAMRGSGYADEYDCTVAQVSDSPDGFSNSLKITTGTAESTISADEYYLLYQPIEAQNLQSLGYGTSSAKRITLSFYVKSSLTGTFGTTLYQGDDNRVINTTYTIDSANTWERKTITFPGDTTGVINNDNGGGMWVYWTFGAGSDFDGASATTWTTYTTTNLVNSSGSDALITTAGATWQVTGVQLEVGEQATPFEHRSFGDELARCQRYFTVINDNLTGDSNDYAAYPAARWSSSQIITTIPLPTSLRASATVSLSGANIQLQSNGSSTAVSTVTHINTGRTQVSIIGNVGFTPASQTAGVGLFLSGARLSLDAEL
jgi:hypothetical protein